MKWLLYADPEVAPLGRSSGGSITPIIDWLHYADPGMAPLGRSVTPVVLGAWLTQWTFKFPPGSVGASATAAALFLGFLAGIIPVPVATAKLKRNPSARTTTNTGLTLLAAVPVTVGLLLVLALLARR